MARLQVYISETFEVSSRLGWVAREEPAQERRGPRSLEQRVPFFSAPLRGSAEPFVSLRGTHYRTDFKAPSHQQNATVWTSPTVAPQTFWLTAYSCSSDHEVPHLIQ